jgi:sarcosine oxidase subunit alpha
VTLSGPKARDVLVSLGSDIDLDQEAFPHMSWRQGKIAGMHARVARVSFTGELTFEISVASDQTETLWDLSSAAAKPFSGAPIGINAWNLLRLEKSFLHIGADTDGTTLPADIGWTKVANRDVDFVGRRSLLWTCNQSPDRLQLVGLAAHDPLKVPPIGMAVKSMDPHRRTDGFVTSSEMSPSLNRPVTLAMVRAGRARIGETITLMNGQTCQIVSGAAYDPEGARLYV